MAIASINFELEFIYVEHHLISSKCAYIQHNNGFNIPFAYLDVPSPWLQIFVLCVFLTCRGVNDGFKVNTQSHLVPVLATSVKVI